jgi:BRCT domain type II-containing protein
VNYLVVGEKPGPAKVSKAKEIGVEMLREIEFYEKFGLSPEEEN